MTANVAKKCLTNSHHLNPSDASTLANLDKENKLLDPGQMTTGCQTGSILENDYILCLVKFREHNTLRTGLKQSGYRHRTGLSPTERVNTLSSLNTLQHDKALPYGARQTQ